MTTSSSAVMAPSYQPAGDRVAVPPTPEAGCRCRPPGTSAAMAPLPPLPPVPGVDDADLRPGGTSMLDILDAEHARPTDLYARLASTMDEDRLGSLTSALVATLT